MTIFCVGDYDPAYNRTSVMLSGLRLAGAVLTEYRSEKHGISACKALFKKLSSLRRADWILVPHSNTRLLVPFLRCFLPRAKIAVDMLYALDDNWIDERNYFNRYSFVSFKLRCLDFLTMRCASAVIVENNAHAEYFSGRFGINRKKFHRVFVGADTERFRPMPRTHEAESFVVEFHGKFFPMQGTDTIVRAAALLKDDPAIQFTLIGEGQLHEQVTRLARELGCKEKISFVPWVSHDELLSYVSDADVTLGLLGNFPRVFRSMPNKLFEAAAAGRLTITADTPAVRELFTDGKDIALVAPGDPALLAEKIRFFNTHRADRDRMEQSAYETFLSHATPKKIGAELAAFFASAA